jgi:hypothetical protein
MRKKIPKIFFLVAFGALSAVANAQDAGAVINLKKAPDSETSLKLLAMGPEQASGVLWQELSKEYQPGRPTGGGSTTNEAFRAWLALAGWFTLLAQKDDAEFARFLTPLLAFGEKDGQRVLFWRPADTSFSDGVEEVSEEERKAIATDPEARNIYLGRYIPGAFQWRDAR